MLQAACTPLPSFTPKMCAMEAESMRRKRYGRKSCIYNKLTNRVHHGHSSRNASFINYTILPLRYLSVICRHMWHVSTHWDVGVAGAINELKLLFSQPWLLVGLSPRFMWYLAKYLKIFLYKDKWWISIDTYIRFTVDIILVRNVHATCILYWLLFVRSKLILESSVGRRLVHWSKSLNGMDYILLDSTNSAASKEISRSFFI